MSVSLSPQYTQRYYSWTNWKVVQAAKSLITQYDDNGVVYTIWGYDGPEVHLCTIYKGVVPDGVITGGYSQATNDSDKSDFQTNFLPTANSAISPDTKVGTAAPPSATSIGASDGTNLIQLRASASTPAGTEAALIVRNIPSGTQTVSQFAALSAAVDGYATLTATGDNALIAAGGVGVKNYITSISASNTSATGVRIDFKDGSTVKHSFYLAPTGGGLSHIFPFPWILGSNAALNVAISAAVTDIRVSATGFKL